MSLDLHGYWPAILDGATLTLTLSLSSVAVAILLGLLGAWGKLSANPIAQRAANLYTTLIRGVPDLLLMLLLFFGGQILLNNLTDALEWDYIELNPFTAGTLAIGVIFGAYMTETFRGAIIAIDKGEIEAGHACGMTRALIFRRIIIPQMIRLALPSFGNNWLVLIKTTALVSILGLTDMVYQASLAAGATREPFTFHLAVAALYLVFTSVSLLVFRWAERRFSISPR